MVMILNFEVFINMKIRITESQYNILVNKARDVVFGKINEGRKPRETPEEIDTKIEDILNHVRNGGEFIRDEKKDDNYKWLYHKSKTVKPEKFEKAFDQIKKIQDELENKKIEGILNHVRNGGEFGKKSDNKYYNWLYYKSQTDKTGKFQNALDQIKEIQDELEDKKIEEILNHVRNGGEFTRLYGQDDNYSWLTSKKQSNKNSLKFQNVFDQIKEIQNELEDKKIEKILNHVRNGGEFTRIYGKDDNFKWLKNKSKTDKTGKFQKALDQINEIQVKLGIKREWWGEKTIKDILITMGFKDIPGQGQHKYKDCKNSLTCRFYKFDIYLPYNENNYMVGKNKGFYIPETGIIFEYDGPQHFKPNEHFGGEEEFIKRIRGDKEKNLFCKNHKPNPIKLVRIPYTSKTKEDIKSDIELALKDPSTFILTGDYPKAGWNK
jgi:uncharacterized protein YjgD (DUF1641 family)